MAEAKKILLFPETFFKDANNRVCVASIEKIDESPDNTKLQQILLLKEMLLETTGQHIDLIYDEHGKPWIPNSNTGFSLSHSKDFIAIILSENYNPGIDTESHRPSLEKIVPRLLHDSERDFLEHCSNRQMALQFIWGAKEAVYKSWGKRGLIFAEDMVLEPFQTTGNDQLKCHFKKDGLHWIYSLQAIAFPGNYLVFTTSVIDQNAI
jgi:phosphopantetheinyl transferase